MKLRLDVVTRNGKKYYYARQSTRNGKKTGNKTVMSFGEEQELLKLTDNPHDYCQQKIEQYEKEHADDDEFEKKISFSDQKLPEDNTLNVGYFFLQYIMKDLKIEEFVNKAMEKRRIKFNCAGAIRFLIYSRVIEPASKLRTASNLATYFEKPDIAYHHLMRAMDFLEDNHDDYLAWLYKRSCKCVKRNTSVIYYDCTNFYCEIEQADDEFVDPNTGVIMEGLRQYGISKEHRPNPIVEMGLFTDKDGIPITMGIDPGNKQETTTAIPLEKEVVKLIGPNKKLIYCADAGLGTYNIRRFNSFEGRAFIVTQSIKKLSDALQQAVFNDVDYRLMSNNMSVSLKDMQTFDVSNEDNLWLYEDRAYKIFTADKALDCGLYDIIDHGSWQEKKKVTELLPQRIIVTFSRQLMEYQRHVRNRQIERAKKRLETCDPDTIKKSPNDINRFIKAVKKDKDGNAIDTKYELDTKRIEEEEKYDGFYALATNLEDDPEEQSAWDIMMGITHEKKAPGIEFVRKIFEILRNRYQIEDCFRALKHTFQTRPIYHYKHSRVDPHFLLCYTALLVERLLQKKLLENNTPITQDELIITIQRLRVVEIDGIFNSTFTGSDTVKYLINLTGIELDKAKYRPTTLHKMINNLIA